MKKITLSDSELKLVVILLSCILLASAWFFGFTAFSNKADEVKTKNKATAARVNELESKVARRAEIEENTIQCNQLVEDIIAKYPADVPTEKAIYLVQDIEDSVGAHFSTINFMMDTRLMALEGNATDEVATVSGPVGYYDMLTMSYDASYDDFKDMIDYIHDYSDRMTVPNITAAYDSETGEISGVLSVRMYYLTETGRDYIQIPDTGIKNGVSNIFGGE